MVSQPTEHLHADEALLRLPGRRIASDPEVGQALDRIDAGATFRHSGQLRRLLRYLVTHAQAGEANALREIAVGVAALGRDAATFDPKQDPIVRTEARRLRAKLAAYYDREGREDPIQIELPKGSYVPLIRRALPPGAIDAASIAVLPFANFTGDEAQGAFCDALTDELIDALARIEGLRVVARTSAFRFKGASEDVRTIANALHVSTLLEGSVQRSGERIRVLAQLVLGSDGRHIWSQAFEANRSALPDVQQALADDIVASLVRTGVLPSNLPEGQARPPRGTRDPDARDRYDRALAILRTLDATRFPRARDLLAEAIARDPGFARAHHLLALDLTNRVAVCALSAQDAMPAATAHLERALALDPDFAQARALLAWIAGVYQHDWDRAFRHVARAVRDAPGNSAVRNTSGNLHALFGRFAEAEAELALARELDPLHLTPRYNAALAAFYAGELAVALERCDAILDVEPEHAANGLRLSALIVEGRGEVALQHAQSYAARHPADSIATARLAEALALNGDLGTALRTLDDAHEPLAAAGATHWARAHVHAVAGDVDAAFACLDAACHAHESNTESASVSPYFRALHADPRWPRLVGRHGLPAIGRLPRVHFAP